MFTDGKVDISTSSGIKNIDAAADLELLNRKEKKDKENKQKSNANLNMQNCEEREVKDQLCL